MATFTIFHEAVNNIGKNLIDLDSHTIKCYLTNTTPVQATHTVKADITEISGTATGYTAGGATITISWAETGAGTGVWRFTSSTNPAWTASGGSIATHRYLIVYSDTATNDELIGYVDRGSSDIIADGNTRTWSIGASGLFEASMTP